MASVYVCVYKWVSEWVLRLHVARYLIVLLMCATAIILELEVSDQDECKKKQQIVYTNTNLSKYRHVRIDWVCAFVLLYVTLSNAREFDIRIRTVQSDTLSIEIEHK